MFVGWKMNNKCLQYYNGGLWEILVFMGNIQNAETCTRQPINCVNISSHWDEGIWWVQHQNLKVKMKERVLNMIGYDNIYLWIWILKFKGEYYISFIRLLTLPWDFNHRIKLDSMPSLPASKMFGKISSMQLHHSMLNPQWTQLSVPYQNSQAADILNRQNV